MEIHNIRWKLSVSRRAITGGITRVAAINVTPITVIVDAMVAARIKARRMSVTAVFTPETSATSASKVENRSWR